MSATEAIRCALSTDFKWHAGALLCGEMNLAPRTLWGCRFQSCLGLSDQFYRDLPRVVLCRSGTDLLTTSWTKKEARRHATQLVGGDTIWRSIVMLGSKTKGAFYYERPFFSHDASVLNANVRLVCLPGPQDREWRDARLVARAHQLLREVVPSLPWGTVYDPLMTLGFALQCAAECAVWSCAMPAALRERAVWTADDFMVALDAVEQRGIDRARGEYFARLSGRWEVAA